MGILKSIEFDNAGNVVKEIEVSAPVVAPKDITHNCPRCHSYFYGRFEGFDGAPFFCGNCGFTYPEISNEALRAMHEKNGTLEAYDNGELIDDEAIDITVE